MTRNPPPGAPSEADVPESRSRALRLFGVPAILALAGYFALYACDTHLRDRRGPWEVTFEREPDGTPAVRIDHAALGIHGVRVLFPGERVESTNGLPGTIRFDEPQKPVPFGTNAFADLMYLPGTVVLHCFGHEVQMLPRTLYLDRAPHGWSNGVAHRLEPGTKPVQLIPPPRTSRLGR